MNWRCCWGKSPADCLQWHTTQMADVVGHHHGNREEQFEGEGTVQVLQTAVLLQDLPYSTFKQLLLWSAHPLTATWRPEKILSDVMKGGLRFWQNTEGWLWCSVLFGFVSIPWQTPVCASCLYLCLQLHKFIWPPNKTQNVLAKPKMQNWIQYHMHVCKAIFLHVCLTSWKGSVHCLTFCINRCL